MSRYAIGQTVFAVVVVVLGVVKGARILLDQIDDALADFGGLA